MPYYKNKNTNILFIHIPKTGGSSIENYFSRKFNIPLDEKSLKSTNHSNSNKEKYKILPKNIPLQHLTYTSILRFRRFFQIKRRNLKIITAVRNPYERLVSDLFFLNKINKNTPKKNIYQIILNFIKENPENHALPQHRFIINYHTRRIPRNITILKTEKLTEEMVQLGYNDFNLYQNKNKVNNVNYYDYLNKKSIQLINFYYHLDFILFHYNKIHM
jgi:hypothetical protein